MALSRLEQDQLDHLVEKRKAAQSRRDRAQQEYDVLGLELRAFLASQGLQKATTTDGQQVVLVSTVDWRHLDTELVERDFPKTEYPDIYTPEYRLLKALVNVKYGVKDPESTAAVSKYTGHYIQLQVKPPKQKRKNPYYPRRTTK